MSIKDLRRLKRFPQDYSKEVVNIIQKMSFSSEAKDMAVVGSMSMRSQLYAGDYDCFETIKLAETSDKVAVDRLTKRFKQIVSDLLKLRNIYVGDIKAGSIVAWEVIDPKAHIKNDKVIGYDSNECKAKLLKLKTSKVITDEEYKTTLKKLITSPSPEEFITIKNSIRFNILRWKAKDVLNGYLTLRNGDKFTLEQAFITPAIVKVDVIAYVQNSKYTDFSVIYQFFNNNKVLNDGMMKIEPSLKENVLDYFNDGNYFKMSKRMFALAKLKNWEKDFKVLGQMFNGDLGRIYSVFGDIGTMLYIFQNEQHIQYENIEYEIDNFRNRLSNVYYVAKYLTEEQTVFKIIERISVLPKTNASKAKFISGLQELSKFFNEVLQYYSKQYLDANGYKNISKKFLP